MLETYPAIYRDHLGEEKTTIQNDGTTLRMVIRDVEFSGDDFDSLEPSPGTESSKLASFTLYSEYKWLCSCLIECHMPIPIVFNNGVITGELGEPKVHNNGIDRLNLLLELKVDGQSFRSCGKHGYFEDELLEIQKSLPSSMYLKACINCAFSDYSPVGHGMFGNMACFRDNKQQYLTVKSKYDLFKIWNTSFSVQETYLCPEFERRKPGTGY